MVKNSTLHADNNITPIGEKIYFKIIKVHAKLIKQNNLILRNLNNTDRDTHSPLN